jgi:hypothetical protein
MKKGSASRTLLRAGAVLLLTALAGTAPGFGQRSPVHTGLEMLEAVGDLHGAYDGFVAILQGTKLVDQDLRWTGGKAHLVQIGDILDRGPGARSIFVLIRRLEGESAAAGGGVHMLIGNHEAIALMGLSFDYEGAVTVEQFLSFLPERFRKAKEAEFRRKAGPEADLAPLWDQLARNDLGAQSAYYEFLNEHYGRWIADHDTAVKIDGVVFVHGGINLEYSRWPLEKLNQAVSMELLGVMSHRPAPPRILFDNRGPLWYRDDADPSKEEIMAGEIERVLVNLDAKALVVGHTATIGSRTLQMSRLGGRVWTIDTGIWEPFSGRLGALVIENGHFGIWSGENERHNLDRRGGRLSVGGAGAALR